MLKKSIFLTVILIGVFSLGGVGSALAITFNTPSGSTDMAGDPVCYSCIHFLRQHSYHHLNEQPSR
jgi:hypothetical protein